MDIIMTLSVFPHYPPRTSSILPVSLLQTVHLRLPWESVCMCDMYMQLYIGKAKFHTDEKSDHCLLPPYQSFSCSVRTSWSIVVALKPHFSFLKLSVYFAFPAKTATVEFAERITFFLVIFLLSAFLLAVSSNSCCAFWGAAGNGGGKAMWNVNAPSPNCRLVSFVLYIYDYEAICIKFTPFQILKIALLRKNRCTFSIPGWLITVLWRRHNIFIKLSVSRKMNTSWNNHTNVISEHFHLQRVSASFWASGPSYLDQSIPSGASNKPCPECDGTLSTNPCH